MRRIYQNIHNSELNSNSLLLLTHIQMYICMYTIGTLRLMFVLGMSSHEQLCLQKYLPSQIMVIFYIECIQIMHKQQKTRLILLNKLNHLMYPVQAYHQQQMESFPYIQAQNYASKQSIVQSFPQLKHINTNRDWNTKKNLDGVIIRSANDDNVHKAIKYGIWATTSKNRTKLSQLFARARLENRQVYLFFSVVKSGMFQGVAKLVSGMTEDTFPYWWDDFSMKFKGYFKIQWVYIKDVNYNHFDNIYNMQSEQVIKSKDCDLLDNATTQKMMNIFQNKPIKNKWIFNDFPYMDKRQRQYTRRLQQQNLTGYQYPAQYQNYAYISGMNNMNMGNIGTNMNMGNSYGNYNPQMMPFPPQMMKPMGQNQLPSHSQLGFQMNPVSSKQKKK